MEDLERDDNIVRVAAGGIAVVAVAAALVAVRSFLASTDVALVLVVVIVAAAVSGGRRAGAITAVLAALSFDFFHTKPYNQLRIASRDDIVTTLLLLVVGLLVGHVASLEKRAHTSAAKSSGEIRRIYRVAELAAKGEAASDVIMGAQAELTVLLALRDCRFESAPFRPPLERLERSGVVSWSDHRLSSTGFALPHEGVELAVLGRGQLLGRFVLRPTEGAGASLEQRVVAVAIADQVGAVLAAPQPGEKGQISYG